MMTNHRTTPKWTGYLTQPKLTSNLTSPKLTKYLTPPKLTSYLSAEAAHGEGPSHEEAVVDPRRVAPKRLQSIRQSGP